MSEQNHKAHELRVMNDDDLERLLNRAAKYGAQMALKDMGLEGHDAARDIRELRSLLQALHLAKRTAWQTFIRVITVGVLAAFMAGLLYKFNGLGE